TFDATEFHVYAVDWTPAGVDFFIDDACVKSVQQSPDYPMQLMLAVYVFPDRIRPKHPPRYPHQFVVDYVRGYRAVGT
ncbi:MAG TPA: glycoside hydrolase family 16 protein, partial [Propionibacteriaceae bacterium]